MAWAHVQDASTTLTASSGTTLTPAFTGAATVGNQVIIGICSAGLTPTITSISGFGVTTGWRLLHCFQNTGGGTPMTQWFYGATVVTGSLTTATVTFSGTITAAASNMMEFSGGTLNIDAVATAQGSSSTAQNAGTISPSSANTLVIAGISMTGTSTVSAAPLANTVPQATIGSTTAARNIACCWLVETTRAGQACAWTMGTARVGLMTVMFLQAADTVTAAYATQGCSAYSAASQTSLAVHPLTPAAGNALIAIVTDVGLGATAVTVADGAVNTWQRAGSKANGTSAAVEIWYAMNVAASAVTVTATFASATASINVMEWAGLATSSMVDAVGAGGSGTAAGTAANGGVTTVAANTMILSAVADAAAQRETAAQTSPYGDQTGIVNIAPINVGGWQAVAAQSTYSQTFALSSGAYAAIAISFVIATGGAVKAMASVMGSLSGASITQFTATRPLLATAGSVSGMRETIKAFRPIATATGSVSGARESLIVRRPLAVITGSVSGMAAALKRFVPLRAPSSSASAMSAVAVVFRPLATKLGSTSSMAAALSLLRTLKALPGGSVSAMSATRLTITRSMASALGSISLMSGIATVRRAMATTLGSVSNMLGDLSLFGKKTFAVVMGSVTGMSDRLTVRRSMQMSLASTSAMAAKVAVQRAMRATAGSVSGMVAALTKAAQAGLAEAIVIWRKWRS